MQTAVDKRKKAMYLCFVVETALEMRMKQISAENPYVEIEVAKDKELIYVSVTDKGLPYILTDNQRRMIGNGFVDGYKLEQLGSEGQRIVFRLRQDELAEMEMPEAEKEELLDSEISIRRTQATEEDANEIVRCFYSAYGYNYTHQSMYRLDELRRMLSGRHYISLLAQNAHGQTLGHLALNEEAEELPGLYEYCNLITKPFARGKGVARLLAERVSEVMQGLKDAQGGYMLGAAFHTATQKLSNLADFTPTGFHLQFFPGEFADRIYRKGEARLSCFYSVSLTDKARLHTLHIPQELKPFTQRIFEREKASFVFAGEDGAAEESIVSVEVDAHLRTAKIYADQCGDDLKDKLNGILGGREM